MDRKGLQAKINPCWPQISHNYAHNQTSVFSLRAVNEGPSLTCFNRSTANSPGF